MSLCVLALGYLLATELGFFIALGLCLILAIFTLIFGDSIPVTLLEARKVSSDTILQKEINALAWSLGRSKVRVYLTEIPIILALPLYSFWHGPSLILNSDYIDTIKREDKKNELAGVIKSAIFGKRWLVMLVIFFSYIVEFPLALISIRRIPFLYFLSLVLQYLLTPFWLLKKQALLNEGDGAEYSKKNFILKRESSTEKKRNAIRRNIFYPILLGLTFSQGKNEQLWDRVFGRRIHSEALRPR